MCGLWLSQPHCSRHQLGAGSRQHPTSAKGSLAGPLAFTGIPLNSQSPMLGVLLHLLGTPRLMYRQTSKKATTEAAKCARAVVPGQSKSACGSRIAGSSWKLPRYAGAGANAPWWSTLQRFGVASSGGRLPIYRACSALGRLPSLGGAACDRRLQAYMRFVLRFTAGCPTPARLLCHKDQR